MHEKRHSHGMGGMDMSGGMDAATSGMFKPTNEAISHAFWYIITALVAIGLLGNILSRVDSTLRFVVVLAKM
jgi:hypothetical protein